MPGEPPEAAAGHGRVLPLFIVEPDGGRPEGAASAWWRHHSLERLDASLRALGSRLLLRRGDPRGVLGNLARETGAARVYWNREFDRAGTAGDGEIENALRRAGVRAKNFNGRLLFEPGEILRADGGPFRVFTAFWKACAKAGLPEAVSAQPQKLPPAPGVPGLELGDLGLLPEIDWYQGLAHSWSPGEEAALLRLSDFADTGVAGYPDNRDRPDLEGTSRLSPHLHFGEISPGQILAGLSLRGPPGRPSAGAEAFTRQLGWREFAHHLIFHFPHTVSEPMNPRFSAFPWRSGYAGDLRRWQQGATGVPLVDAGMRELWHTGWMHNRVRMVAASFLTKNLLIPWQEGAAWFHDTLVDADLANNTLGWQWVAGCGADAAPYFRVFNPVLQGEKFDPEGVYVRHWIPELGAVPARFVHRPWDAAPAQRRAAEAAGYPPPMVDLRKSRERALEAYRAISG